MSVCDRKTVCVKIEKVNNVCVCERERELFSHQKGLIYVSVSNQIRLSSFFHLLFF